MTKDTILSLLRQSPGEFVSGEVIRQAAGVSRAAVSKAVAVLRQEGHEIESVTNRGYRLISLADSLRPEELRQRLGIETEEDAAALDELLQAYGLTPEEILAGLAEMEADPEAEKIDSLEALQALLEAAAAVETLETEDGTLVPKTGGGYTGTVTVGDLTVTVDTTTWTTGMGGYRLQVTASDTEPVKMDHGRVVVDKGIKVEILTADGMPYTCGELTFTVDAASPMTESENPKIYHHVDGALAEWDSWQKVKLSEDKKTLTTGNQITAPAEFLIDHWEPLTETYLDWPGASYSIGYILRKYNVFVENNYDGTHVVGPVVADEHCQVHHEEGS